MKRYQCVTVYNMGKIDRAEMVERDDGPYVLYSDSAPVVPCPQCGGFGRVGGWDIKESKPCPACKGEALPESLRGLVVAPKSDVPPKMDIPDNVREAIKDILRSAGVLEGDPDNGNKSCPMWNRALATLLRFITASTPKEREHG